jgi:hypothetical protein
MIVALKFSLFVRGKIVFERKRNGKGVQPKDMLFTLASYRIVLECINVL